MWKTEGSDAVQALSERRPARFFEDRHDADALQKVLDCEPASDVDPSEYAFSLG
jgi:hypothetical protein